MISAISAIVACIATWISYRMYQDNRVLRRNDRIMGLRVRACELHSRASNVLNKFMLAAKFGPEPEADASIMSRYQGMMDITENLDALLVRAASDASNAGLDDMELSLRRIEGELQSNEQRLDLILERI
ncbi:hypothetical protein MARLIPOL_18113 [Marinobacter lipolyticus SM19]|uniref:DUF2489 domain-containing protein n=2 Tax=Marinobacter lipolyticus TaxID=209639 RepID=R8AW68_9GAMM|nr:hypothetical protein MARLIPOL_18113 [Marinobacter lipolyticus SM19]